MCWTSVMSQFWVHFCMTILNINFALYLQLNCNICLHRRYAIVPRVAEPRAIILVKFGHIHHLI
jgi:hypothetical protein